MEECGMSYRGTAPARDTIRANPRPDVMNTYIDFSTNHLPSLFKYVVPIGHEDEDDGEESIGSGVMVNVHGRHFIATARHCIKQKPRVMIGDWYLKGGKITASRPVKILRSEWHDSLDVGFLEVEEMNSPCTELQPHQLCCDRIVEGMIHVVGHPTCMIKRDEARKEICLTRAAFGTHLEEETSEYLRFAYPREGVRFDASRDEWVTGPFIATPHGFSGGGCFGVTQASSPSGLIVFGYKLLGIQYRWDGVARWVKAVPTRQWINLLNERCGGLISENETPI
jgi:hypothetical protein